MYPIIILMVVMIICNIVDFPGGPTGFAIATKQWLKRKNLVHKNKVRSKFLN